MSKSEREEDSKGGPHLLDLLELPKSSLRQKSCVDQKREARTSVESLIEQTTPTKQSVPEPEFSRSNSLRQKRVKFNSIVNQHEYTPSPLHSSAEISPRKEDFSDDSEVPISGLEDPSGESSDAEDIENSKTFRGLKQASDQAKHERKYLMETLKAKSRVGSIFIDQVKRVVAAVQREPGIYDFLVEWEFQEQDKLKPTTSVVNGLHFVLEKPLLYRKHVEQTYIEHANKHNSQ